MFLKISQISPEGCSLIKKETGTGVFLWILRNFKEHLFLWNILGGRFYLSIANVSFWKKKNSFLVKGFYYNFV